MTFELLLTRQFSVVLGYTSYMRSPNDERKARCVRIVLFVKSSLITGRLFVRKDKGENIVTYFYQSVKTLKIYIQLDRLREGNEIKRTNSVPFC